MASRRTTPRLPRRLSRHRSASVVALSVALVLVTSGCGGSQPSTADDGTDEITTTVDVAGTTIVDVRTPEEFAEGHLPGAVNLPLEDGTLESALDSLDQGAAHLVYCRSGRRSEIAVELMSSRGFSDVTNLGGLDEAVAATGLSLTAG